MVHREKKVNLPPKDLMDPKWDGLKSDVLIYKNSHEPNSKCYRDTTLNYLLKLYNHKCAFCESSRGEELQVDHYRPRKKRDYLTEIQYNQPGYYWLTYEWSNLIPLCSKCNGNKSNKFPLQGFAETNRINNHLNVRTLPIFSPFDVTWLQSYENPLLINPELESYPEKHFIFQKNGKIVGRTIEGIETIKICLLNRRDLIRNRLTIVHNIVIEINEALSDFMSNNNEDELRGALKTIFKTIKKNTHIDEEHSLYYVFIYKFFDYFIGTKLDRKVRKNIVDYFEEFKLIS